MVPKGWCDRIQRMVTKRMVWAQTKWVVWGAVVAAVILVVLVSIRSHSGESVPVPVVLKEAANPATQQYFESVYSNKAWGDFGGGSGLVRPTIPSPSLFLWPGCISNAGLDPHMHMCYWCPHRGLHVCAMNWFETVKKFYGLLPSSISVLAFLESCSGECTVPGLLQGPACTSAGASNLWPVC
jgi:hypothetical protein